MVCLDLFGVLTCCVLQAIPYATWRQKVLETMRLQRAAGKVIHRWGLLALIVPYQSWADNADASKRLAKAAEKIVTRWKCMALARPWTAWVIGQTMSNG